MTWSDFSSTLKKTLSSKSGYPMWPPVSSSCSTKTITWGTLADTRTGKGKQKSDAGLDLSEVTGSGII